MTETPEATSKHQLQRELYFFNLYRLLEAALLALTLFDAAPLLQLRFDMAAIGTLASTAYLGFAFWILLRQRQGMHVVPAARIGVLVDIGAGTLALWLLPNATAAVAILMLFNIAAASVLLPRRDSLLIAGTITLIVLLDTLFNPTNWPLSFVNVIQRGLFAFSFIGAAHLAWMLAQAGRESLALAEQRGMQVQSLGELNELIIRRMRTGVLLVNPQGQVQLANEAAIALFGDKVQLEDMPLATAAPLLATRLQRWKNLDNLSNAPLQIGHDSTEIMPRFVYVQPDIDETVVVFLDDASHLSRRAETISLAALGRFSASLAHEIRNPLAAIRYAAQLLQESNHLDASDQHLLSIILQQCNRTNGIIESVLGMARREHARPNRINLNQTLLDFVELYRQMHPEQGEYFQVQELKEKPIIALVDEGHLQQILTILVNNAFNYGQLPGQVPRVRLNASLHSGKARIDVSDRGPGIPERIVTKLFEPFTTTSEHGTGLGLYIARELCRSNQGYLSYHALPGGGSCFRITLPTGDGSTIVDHEQ